MAAMSLRELSKVRTPCFSHFYALSSRLLHGESNTHEPFTLRYSLFPRKPQKKKNHQEHQYRVLMEALLLEAALESMQQHFV